MPLWLKSSARHFTAKAATISMGFGSTGGAGVVLVTAAAAAIQKKNKKQLEVLLILT